MNVPAVFRYGLGGLAALMVLVMTAVTAVDVTGRYVLGTPLTGAFEITELSLAALVFLGLPLATQTDEHIRVDLLDSIMPDALRRMSTLVVDWMSALVLAVLAWQLWRKTASLLEDAQVTNTLEIPLAPIGMLMSASCALSAVVLAVKGVLALRSTP